MIVRRESKTCLGVPPTPLPLCYLPVRFLVSFECDLCACVWGGDLKEGEGKKEYEKEREEVNPTNVGKKVTS